MERDIFLMAYNLYQEIININRFINAINKEMEENKQKIILKTSDFEVYIEDIVTAQKICSYLSDRRAELQKRFDAL